MHLHRPPGRSTGQGAVYDALVMGDAKRLKWTFERLDSEQQERMLTWRWGGSLQGTLHFGALSMCVTLVHSDAGNGNLALQVEQAAACVDYIRSLKAPCLHAEGDQGAAVAFLEHDWDDRHSRQVVELLLRRYLDEGYLDPNQVIENHPLLGGMLPLQAAFYMGNVIATKQLLEAGADMQATLQKTGHHDIVECARSFGEPRSDVVASVVAEALLSRRLGQTSDNLQPETSAVEVAKSAQRRMRL